MHVIAMVMSGNYRIDPANMRFQKLSAKVGAAVDEYANLTAFDQD